MTALLVAIMVAVLPLVETPNGVPARPGPFGETGRWQLTDDVRHDRGAELRARGEAITDEAIAREQVRWLARQLVAHGIDPSPFNVALAWNAGLTRVLEAKAPERAYRFARKVERLTKERAP